ncbi:hypothetical protein [Aquimarina algicola]|uniref:Uncharacterized protein n=1 Tax=Aquimarina algicola TaxID=2589995 RepID=A0A504J8L8_9FLAO|nr:hypothetical protein [Aquimarina algicola]TPN83399.1 hypothetical protein FHK87_19450 [Aquimarina algicola]
MGLSERRVAKKFEEEIFPELKKDIEQAAKKSLEFEVEWKSIAIDGMSHLYEECWPQVYFEPIKIALGNITVDDMGAEAIEESLSKIVIKNEKETSSPSKWCTFEDNILILDHKPTTNVNQIQDRADAIQKMLEDNL